MEKFQNGAFVFYRASHMSAHDPEHVRQMARDIGIDSSVVPDYAGDRQAVSRAISRTNSGLARRGWELTSIKTKRHDVVYGISAVRVDQKLERVDFAFDDTLRWTDEHGNGQRIEGNHTVALEVDKAYQELRGKIVQADWTAAITDYLLGQCQATAMRDDGRVYWCPPQSIGKVQKYSQLLASVGIALVCCEIEAESRTVVEQAATESLYDKLTELEAEAALFDGKQKPTTYKLRLEQYRKLRERATTYREALGIGVEKAQQVLDRLEREVGNLLDVRQRTTIPIRSSTPTPEPTAPATIPTVDPTQYTPPASMQATSASASLSFNF